MADQLHSVVIRCTEGACSCSHLAELFLICCCSIETNSFLSVLSLSVEVCYFPGFSYLSSQSPLNFRLFILLIESVGFLENSFLFKTTISGTHFLFAWWLIIGALFVIILWAWGDPTVASISTIIIRSLYPSHTWVSNNTNYRCRCGNNST